MRDNWKTVKLGDVVDVRDGTHDSPKKAIVGKYLITSKHIKNDKVDFSNAYKISLIDFNEVNRRSQVEKWNILFTMIGTVAELALIDFEPDFAIKNVGLIRTNNENLSRWVFYYLKSEEARNEIYASLKGSTQQYMTLGDLRNFPINLPPLSEQKAIARILGSLDDKIELNRQMNRTLEDIAQAIFKAWFVDFEPFKDGNFVESELGMIPEGWRVNKVSEIIEINPRLSLKKGEVVQYVDMKGMPTSGHSVLYKIKREFKGGSKFQNKDILLARITPCLENGKTAMVDFLKEKEIGSGSTEFIVLRQKGAVKPEFIYCLSRNENFRNHCIASMVGSSGRQRVQMDCFDYYKIAVPKGTVFENFHKLTKPYFELITKNQREIESLIQTRDTLLPKLISGEIGVNA